MPGSNSRPNVSEGYEVPTELPGSTGYVQPSFSTPTNRTVVVPQIHQIRHQPGMVANTACGKRSRLRGWSREVSSTVPSRVSPPILHAQSKSDAYSRDSSSFPRRRLIYTVSRHRVNLEFMRSRATVYRRRSPPTVRRGRARNSQGSSSNRCCLQYPGNLVGQ